MHTHDDLGLAVGNSLAAVHAGARQVEGALNGIGERAGNCSLEEVIMVLFFISIFSVTLNAETPDWARLTAWAGIVLASVIWRIFLSQAFSLPAVRRAYGRMQSVASRVIGAIISVFALRLIYEGIVQR